MASAVENKKKDKVQKRKFSQPLKVNLTEQELLDAGEEISRAMTEKERLEDDVERIKQQYKGKISSEEAAIQKNKTLLQDKYEFRPVQCEEVRDFKNGTLTITRLDDNTVVTTRKLRDEELQLRLMDDEAAA